MNCHRYKFEDAALAFETAKHGKSEDGKLAIKVMVSGPGVSLDKTS
jgi:D-xylulose reductase